MRRKITICHKMCIEWKEKCAVWVYFRFEQQGPAIKVERVHDYLFCSFHDCVNLVMVAFLSYLSWHTVPHRLLKWIVVVVESRKIFNILWLHLEIRSSFHVLWCILFLKNYGFYHLKKNLDATVFYESEIESPFILTRSLKDSQSKNCWNKSFRRATASVIKNDFINWEELPRKALEKEIAAKFAH